MRCTSFHPSHPSCGCAGLSAVLELGSEPLYILAQSLLLLRFRAGMEALASLVRCLLTLALVLAGVGRVGGRSHWGVRSKQ